MNPSQPHRSPKFKGWTWRHYWTNGENSWTILIIIYSKFGKKSENGIDKYVALVRKSRKLWNNIMAVVPVVSGALGTVTKSIRIRVRELEKKIFGTIQTTALGKTGRILRRVLELLSVYLPWKPLGTTKRNPSKKKSGQKNDKVCCVRAGKCHHLGFWQRKEL